jgi:hypothetical protein
MERRCAQSIKIENGQHRVLSTSSFASKILSF